MKTRCIKIAAFALWVVFVVGAKGTLQLASLGQETVSAAKELFSAFSIN